MSAITSSKVRITFVIPSLHTGGSERVILYLINNFDRDRFDIELIVLKKEGALLHLIKDDIRVVYFNFHRTAHALFPILSHVRKHRPDVLFSTLGHLNLLIALLKPLLPRTCYLVARESSIISIRNKDERYPRLFNFLFKTVYRRFDTIICQSEYMKHDLVNNFGIDEGKISVINNPIDFRLIPLRENKKKNSSSINLISVGQLRPEKGYERMIEALAHCDADFNYSIIGGGPTEKLKELIKKLNLDKKVQLLGQIVGPFDELCAADCLLLGSYYEGFPNVVLEANACGVPVIAFRAPGGHNEIIKQGVNGWFVNSPEEFCQLISTRAFDSLDKESIIALTRERYDLPKIIEQYQNTIMSDYLSFTAG